MAVSEDLNGFFADFGVSASFGGDTVKVLFDSPDTVVAENFVISAEYAITYKTGEFAALANGSSIVVDGTTYTVNTIQAIEDGKLTRATLSA